MAKTLTCCLKRGILYRVLNINFNVGVLYVMDVYPETTGSFSCGTPINLDEEPFDGQKTSEYLHLIKVSY